MEGRFASAGGVLGPETAGCGGQVDRPRLTDVLARQGAAPVAILRAPAGFGKSVLLRQAQAMSRAEGARTVFLSAGLVDRDAHLLVEAVARALAEPGVAPTSGPADQAPRARLGALLLRAADANPRAAIFIDDAHLLAPEALDLIGHLLEHRWPDLRLVLAGREPLRIGLGKVRTRQGVLELCAGDLRFTTAEADAVFANLAAASDPALRKELARMAEGWPAGICLGAPGIAGPSAALGAMSAALGRPSGPLSQYVTEVILDPLDPAAQAFLLQTAPLQTFDAALAREVTGKVAEGYIAALADAGLCAEEAGSGTYRYNPLLAACLEAQLRRQDPARLRAVHAVALAWRQASGQARQAIPHAFAAGDMPAAADLLQAASERHERVGRWRTFTGWISQLAPDLLAAYPAVRAEAACAHAVLFEIDAARAHADAVRADWSSLDGLTRDNILTADALIGAFSDQPDLALEAGMSGLRQASGRDPYTTGTLRLAAALGLIDRGALEKARPFLLEARADHQRAGAPFGAAVSLSLLGHTYAIEGELGAAAATWRQGESIVQPLSTAPAVMAIATGYLPELLYEHDRLGEAKAELDRCFESSAEVALPHMVVSLYLTAVRIAFLDARRAEVSALLDEAAVIGLRRGWPRLVAAIGWERVRLALREGDLAEARRLRAALPPVDSAAEPLPDAELIGALRFEAATQPDRALLSRIRAAASRALGQNRVTRALHLVLVEALARDSLGDRPGALRAARRAVELGANGGFLRSFVDEGPRIADLLRQLAADLDSQAGRDGAGTYLDRLAQAVGRSAPRAADREAAPLEPLSRRELEILGMLAAGLSNRELGDRLFVTENTIKWHLQHIFAKLGVRNRTRAVVVARAQGLIS